MIELLERIEREWTGSDLELEIRAGLPGKFLRIARGEPTELSFERRWWSRLRAFLDELSTAPTLPWSTW